MATRNIKWYGWKPDLPDQRDHVCKLTARRLPSAVDLRGQCPPIYNQGDLGSCVGNATAAAFQFSQMKEGAHPKMMPSRLFIYYNARMLEGTAAEDSGAEIRDGFKAIANKGACPANYWPYKIWKFAELPSAKAYIEAAKHTAIDYSRVEQTEQGLKGCLAQGYPFVLGFTVYESFESDEVARTGIVPMPAQNEKAIGAHAVMSVGYFDETRMFLVRNSWGSDWGIGGYFHIPYSYLLNENLASDFWTLKHCT